jgi:phage tail-like protein
MSRRVVAGAALAIAGLIAVVGIGIVVAGGGDRRIGAASAEKRGYVAGKFVLYDGAGLQLGFPNSVKGCGIGANVVTEQLGPESASSKHISQPVYDPCVIEVGTGMDRSLYDWIGDMLARKPSRKNLWIVATDFAYKAQSGIRLLDAVLTEVKFPALDASSKDIAKLTLTIEAESLRKFDPCCGSFTPGSVSSKGSAAKDVQKKWLPSNFRLKLDGIEVKKVNKIGAWVARQGVAVDEIGEFREASKEPGKLELGDLAVTQPATEVDLDSWFESFVVNGKNDQESEKAATLEFLAPDLKNVLFELTFSGVGIFRMADDEFEAGSENIRRQTFSLYVEQAALTAKPGDVVATSPPPPPPPPPPATTTTPQPPAPEPPPPPPTTTETVPTETTPALEPGPGKLEAVSGPAAGEIQLTWSPVPEGEGYIILIAGEPGGPYEEVGRTRRTSFVVGGLETESPYYFVVRAIVFGEETADSPEASARAG